MIRALALASALALSFSAAATEPSPEAQVNARLDAQLRRTLKRLVVQATHSQLASVSIDRRGHSRRQ